MDGWILVIVNDQLFVQEGKGNGGRGVLTVVVSIVVVVVVVHVCLGVLFVVRSFCSGIFLERGFGSASPADDLSSPEEELDHTHQVQPDIGSQKLVLFVLEAGINREHVEIFKEEEKVGGGGTWIHSWVSFF